LARLRYLLGDREGARRELAAARREVDAHNLPDCRVALPVTAGELALLDGEVATALDHLRDARDRLAGYRLLPQIRARVLTALGSAEVAAGDLATARDHHLLAMEQAVASGDAVA